MAESRTARGALSPNPWGYRSRQDPYRFVVFARPPLLVPLCAQIVACGMPPGQGYRSGAQMSPRSPKQEKSVVRVSVWYRFIRTFREPPATSDAPIAPNSLHSNTNADVYWGGVSVWEDPYRFSLKWMISACGWQGPARMHYIFLYRLIQDSAIYIYI